MVALLNTVRSAWNDFRNVFGRSPATVASRLGKGVSVLRGMIRGDDTASSAMPVRVQIEVTDNCNFDCVMCNRLTRPNVTFKLANNIDHPTFTKLIDRVRPYYVTLNGLGEPALNKSIDRILQECRRRQITTQMPSNMSIKKVMLEKVAPNPPSVLTFSMHGATKQSFEAISVNSDFEQCIALFEAFLEKVDRREVEIRVLCALQARNLGEFNGFYDYLSRWGLLDSLVLVPVFDYPENRGQAHVVPEAAELAASLADLDRELAACADARKAQFLRRWRDVMVSLKRAEEVYETGPCLVPWFSTYITAKGKVLPCCYLTNEDHVLGNIFEEDFEKIWNGPRYQEFRRQLRENRGQVVGCRNCPRNDTDRLRKYNPLSLVRSRWSVGKNAASGGSPPPQGPQAEIRVGVEPAEPIPLTVRGRAVPQAVAEKEPV